MFYQIEFKFTFHKNRISMCRFTFYQGRPIRISSLITEPKHSLIHQSFESEERDEPLNGDGFGLAWYNYDISKEPALFKSITPAWSNRNLQEIAKMIETHTVLAHVRAATQRLEVNESNCHPFKYEKYAFMHNGDIGGFRNIRRHVVNELSDQAFHLIHGTTDSEHFFAILMEEFWKRQSEDNVDIMADSMKAAVERVVHIVDKHASGEACYLNMIFANGKHAIALRYTSDSPEQSDSLYYSHGRRFTCENGICKMMEPGEMDRAVIISSEPLSRDEGWESVPFNHMLLIENGHIIDQMEIKI